MTACLVREAHLFLSFQQYKIFIKLNIAEMVNFIVVNNSLYEIDKINVIYADEQSMDNQQAGADGVTVLSDSKIPAGTEVSEVNVDGTVVTEEPVSIPVGQGRTLLATLIHYSDPNTGQDNVIGMEAESESEG